MKTHVRDRIFKLSPIHALVIYQIPWIQWIPVPFREKSIEYELEQVHEQRVTTCQAGNHRP